MALRVVFFGTPSFAVPTLQRLVESPHTVAGVVTQPDRPRGRGQQVVAEAVPHFARARGLAVLQPDRLRDAAFEDALRRLRPDLGVVAAYGRLLPDAVLAIPRLGMINVHASLLPRWRGAAPVHRAILAGDRTTGVTIMRVVRELDAGPMIRTTATDIGPDETSVELEARLAEIGARDLVAVVGDLDRGPVADTPQDHRQATYAPRLERRESVLDWARPAETVHNHIRGLQPWPAAESAIGGRRVLFRRSRVDRQAAADLPPGTISSVGADSFSVATSPGAVAIVQLQEAGRGIVDARSFLNGRRLAVGDRFG
jgi:methionyl-tRNA formyltransferase